MKPDTWLQAIFAVVAGALMVGLCGLCTFTVVRAPDARILGLLPFIVGGVPMAAGALLIYLGTAALLKKLRDRS